MTMQTMQARLIAAFLVAIVVTSAARAQGTSGMLPDPISARELTSYADRLGLSDQQRLAIEAFHSGYRDEFRILRETEMEEFLRSSGSMGRLFMDPAAVEAMVRDYEQIMARIRALDERLFDQVQGVLTEQQLLGLPRTRLARQRARYGSGVARMLGFLNPASRLDLSSIVHELELTSAEREAVDPILQTYETTLTARVRDMQETGLEQLRAAATRLAAFQLDEQTMADPERRRETMEAMRGLWTDMSRVLTEASMETSELSRKTIPRLQPLLRSTTAFAMHQEFYRGGYGEFANGPNPAVRRFEEALDLEGSAEEQRRAVRDLRDAFFRDLYRITDEAADVIDERRRTQQRFGPGFGNDAERQKLEERLDEQRERRVEANRRAIEALEAVLGQDLASALAPTPAGDASDLAGSVSASLTTPDGQMIQVEASEVDFAASPGAGEPDPFLPSAIADRDVERYADMLQLDEVQRTVLGALHDDYRERFRETAGAAVRRVTRHQQTMWRFDDEKGMVPPTEEQIDQLYVLRRTALEQIVLEDEAFFDDVAGLAGEDHANAMERVRLSRRRDVYNRARGPESGSPRGGGRFAFSFGGDRREASIDVSRLIEGLELEPAAWPALQGPLLEYERAATAAFRDRYERDLSFQKLMDRLNARRSAGGSPDGPRQWSLGPEFRSAMEREGREVREANDRVVALNRSAVDGLASALEDDAATELRRLYERAAFPDVFEDRRSAGPALAAALELPDLSADQRSAIAELNARYRGEHDALSRRMAAIRMKEPSDFQRWQERIEGQRRLETVRAERDDLSERMRVRLRALLDDEQNSRVFREEPDGG